MKKKHGHNYQIDQIRLKLYHTYEKNLISQYLGNFFFIFIVVDLNVGSMCLLFFIVYNFITLEKKISSLNNLLMSILNTLRPIKQWKESNATQNYSVLE